MGVAFFQPDHENHIASRDYLEGQMLKGLGGRAAEEVVFGASKVTSGAASDLQHTTRIAKHMVYRLGMGETAGLIAYDPDSGPVSAETVATDHKKMLEEGRKLAKLAKNVAVKVPLTPDGLKTCKVLSSEGTMVNVRLPPWGTET